MVAKKSPGKKRLRIKVGKLALNKETVKDLSKTGAKRVKGGSGNLCRSAPPTTPPDSRLG